MTALAPVRARAGRDRRDAVVYGIAGRVLDYPDVDLVAELPLLRRAAAAIDQSIAGHLLGLLDHLGTTPLRDLETAYVETFDHQRRCCLYLTYYAFGDTRRRGMALLAFKQAYRQAGLELMADELPDHLCVLLELAATADVEAGRRLLLQHRAGLELLRLALGDAGSPYARAVAAICATLPLLGGDERAAVARLAAAGPPDEEVGLEPFGPPDPRGIRR